MLDLSLTLGPINIELWDKSSEKFVYIKKPQIKVRLKHNLIAIAKWESKWKKPLLHTDLYKDQILDYMNCMRISGPEITEEYIDGDVIEQVKEYMTDTMTATTIKSSGSGQKTIYTNEVIYSLMALAKIPFSCEKWHINRLFMLLAVNSEHRAEPKKKSGKDILRENESLNRMRHQQLAMMRKK